MSHRSRDRLVTRRLVTAGLAALPSLARGQNEDLIVIFASVSLQDAFNKAGYLYVYQTLHPVRFAFGASSALARQIEAGTPADVFISADIDWMDDLARKKLIIPATRRNLFSNHLALIAPAKSKASIGFSWKSSILHALGGGRLAMAGSDTASGRYGQAALTRMGVWPEVKDHIAPAEDVRAAMSLVVAGKAPLGIVYDTDAKLEKGVKTLGIFPDSSHPPIIYPGAVLAGSKNPNAGEFLTDLTSPAEARVFRDLGFRVLKSEGSARSER
jgi:molybdate transport system substrate-binding protein